MVHIFYDGCDLTKFGSYPNVVGFTTNTTIMRQSNQLNYKSFYNQFRDVIQGRPISFQIFSDDETVAYQQAKDINTIGPNIFVKVPVINSKGVSMLPLAQKLLTEGIQVNVTAIFTKDQIDSVVQFVKDTSTPTIVSVFGGRISDTGVNPKEIIKHAVDQCSSNKLIQVLWAGCKDNLVIQNANDIGCQIVTLPDAIISRISRIGQPLDTLSCDTVKSFLKDAIEGELTIL